MGDTETMKKYATIKRLGMQLEYQFQIEEAYPKYIIRKVYERVYEEKPNKRPRVNRYTSFWLNRSKAWFSLAHKHKHKHMPKQVKTGST